MTNTEDRQHRSILQSIAHRAMLERGLLPEFSRQALADLDRIRDPATRAEEPETTMIRAIWISLRLPKQCPEGRQRSLSPLPMWTLSSRSRRHLTIMPGTTLPGYTPLPRYFRCCRRNSRPILPLSTMNQTAWPLSLKWSSSGMDLFRFRTSMERQSAIRQSLPTITLPAGWRVTGRCRLVLRG